MPGPETPFTDEFEKMLMHENGDEKGQDYFEKMYLTDYDGCFHDDYLDDDVTGVIRNKFANVLWFIAEKLKKEGHVKEKPRPVVDASWQDTTHYILVSRPDGQVLFEGFDKAWNFKFENKEELEEGLKHIWDECLKALGKMPNKEAILKFLEEHKGDPELADLIEHNREADVIAQEVLRILVVHCKPRFRKAYDFFADQLDLTDEAIEEAYQVLYG